MKILCVSDIHLDAVTLGVARFPELRRAVRHTVGVATYLRVDAYVFTGDLCDPDSGSVVFRCLEVAQEAAMRLAEARIHSYWLAGNHDVIEDGSGDTVLSPLRALGGLVHVLEAPKCFSIGVHPPWPSHEVNVVALPFTATSHPYDPAAHLERNLRTDVHNLVLSHLNVEGIVPGEETTEMPRGREVLLPLGPLKGRADVTVVQGHYHRRQTHVHEGVTVNVVGSLARLTFGEGEHVPGYLVVEI